MIRAMVREFARTEILPTAAERDRTKEFPRENLRKMVELGLLGMNVPAEYDGAGRRHRELLGGPPGDRLCLRIHGSDHVRPQLRGLRPYLSLRLRTI